MRFGNCSVSLVLGVIAISVSLNTNISAQTTQPATQTEQRRAVIAAVPPSSAPSPTNGLPELSPIAKPPVPNYSTMIEEIVPEPTQGIQPSQPFSTDSYCTPFISPSTQQNCASSVSGGCNPLPAYQMQPLGANSCSSCAPQCRRGQMSFGEVAKQSLFGDVYAAGTWRPLEFEEFLSEGWDEPWAGGPAGGEGLTPRHGWLGANDGVFYRLWLNTFTYQSGAQIGNGLTANAYNNTFSIFLPLNRRFEVLIDTPFQTSNSTSSVPPVGPATSSSHNRFGDVVITPRFLLQESERISQVFAVGIETPTGQVITGGGNTSVTPRYEFWSNPTGAWVARGGIGVNVPVNNNNSSQTTGVGNLAIGRYLTKHDAVLGDLVLYAATNVSVPLDSSGNTTVGIGPGTRFHVTNNWFVLGFANFVVSNSQPYNYQTQVALMKVF